MNFWTFLMAIEFMLENTYFNFRGKMFYFGD